MKQTKRLAGLLLAVAVLCMFGAVTCPAAEIGTQEFIQNGSFEVTTDNDGVLRADGWNLFNSSHASKKTWSDILKTDGASGEGDKYILIEAVKGTDTCNSGLRHSSTPVAPGKDLILSLRYKSSATSAMQIQYTYSASEYDASYQPDNLTLPPTDGQWTDYSLLIPAYAFEIDDVNEPVYADTVGFLFYNVARLAKDVETGTTVAEGDTVTVGFDNVSLRTYTDEGIMKNGDFTLGGSFWGPTVEEGGLVEFADGAAKIKGSASTFLGQTCEVAPASMLPNGFNHTYYKVSVKIKVEAPEGYEGTVPPNPGIKIFGKTSDGSEVNLTSGSWRGTVDIDNGWKQCTYFTTKVATNIENLILYIRGVGADLTMYVDDVVVEPYNFRIHNGSNVNVYTLTPGNKISVEPVVANRTNAAVTVKAWIAFYAEKNGQKQLLQLNFSPAATVDAGAGSGVAAMRANGITIPTPPDGYNLIMRAMIMEEGKLVPHCPVFTMTTAE